jgi:hypothetical protein
VRDHLASHRGGQGVHTRIAVRDDGQPTTFHLDALRAQNGREYVNNDLRGNPARFSQRLLP